MQIGQDSAETFWLNRRDARPSNSTGGLVVSYDVKLVDPETGKAVIVDRHTEGGTYAIGGVDEAELNITYNYSEHFHEALEPEKGLRWLYGKTGRETVERLRDAVIALGTVRDPDYWKSTPGNAGFALSILLRWAGMYPDAVWKGD